jgi:hypothetical protein
VDWLKESGSRYLVGVDWLKESGSMYLVGVDWLKESVSRYLVGVDWLKESGSMYLVGVDGLKESGSRFLVGVDWLKESVSRHLVGVDWLKGKFRHLYSRGFMKCTVRSIRYTVSLILCACATDWLKEVFRGCGLVERNVWIVMYGLKTLLRTIWSESGS